MLWKLGFWCWGCVFVFGGISYCEVVRWWITHRGLLGDQTLPLSYIDNSRASFFIWRAIRFRALARVGARCSFRPV